MRASNMIWIWMIAFAVCVASESMYYHEKSARVFRFPDRPALGLDSSFGFSVSSIGSGSKSKLVVGAPLADNIGKVYTCDLNSNDGNICSSVKNIITRMKNEARDAYKNHNYWFGAKVKGTDTFFVGCAPLIIEESTLFKNSFGTYGRCYIFQYPELNPKQLDTLKPKVRKANYTKHEQTMDSFGWSLDTESLNSIMIGGPAMLSGRVMTVSSTKVETYTTGASSNIIFNFGYDVAFGKFLKKSSIKSIPIMAVGSPYGYDGHGKVAFIETKQRNVMVKGTVEDLFVGSMFGAVLCPAKLSNNELTDLLVGAPTYAVGDDFNAGAVYVYIANSVGKPTYKKKIVGAISGSYFGSAIVSLGDLDGDEIDDFAIGAPYENKGRGTVYLYSGADIMNKDPVVPIQKIAPESTVQSFGYSLAALRDYDDNGCNELAIGAPKSNTVKVLRCLADITIKLLTLKAHVPGNNGLNKSEKLPLCFDAYFPVKPRNVKADIVVKVVIQHDGVSLQEPADGNVIFHIDHTSGKMKQPFCNDITLFISGEKGNYNTEINYVLTASLKDDLFQKADVLPSEVILNKHSMLSQTGKIRVQECGARLCEPKLKMTTTFSEKSPYTIGSSESIEETVSVVNTGEVAYDSCVRVIVTGVSVPRPPDTCLSLSTDDASTLLECKPKQHLRQSNPWTTFISLDTTGLTNKNNSVKVETTLYKFCESLTVEETNTSEYKLIADAESVDINGRTDEGLSDIVNLTRSDIAVQKTFEHVFTIANNGPTNWVDVKIIVDVQKQDFVTKSVYLNNENCHTENLHNYDTIATYYCLPMIMNNHAGIEVKVLMQVTDKLNDFIGKEKLTVQSNITVDLDGTLKKNSVTSELRLVEGKVPIWIIVVASILALIVLLIIFFVLREWGFLERKNKKELKRARTSVRRQTVIRQSMLNRRTSHDQERLVEEAIKSQESKKKDRRVVVNAD